MPARGQTASWAQAFGPSHEIQGLPSFLPAFPFKHPYHLRLSPHRCPPNCTPVGNAESTPRSPGATCSVVPTPRSPGATCSVFPFTQPEHSFCQLCRPIRMCTMCIAETDGGHHRRATQPRPPTQVSACVDKPARCNRWCTALGLSSRTCTGLFQTAKPLPNLTPHCAKGAATR